MKFQKNVEIIVTHKSVNYWTCVCYSIERYFFFLPLLNFPLKQVIP